MLYIMHVTLLFQLPNGSTQFMAYVVIFFVKHVLLAYLCMIIMNVCNWKLYIMAIIYNQDRRVQVERW